MAGATLNDIFDTDVDKINMPFRPLMDGRIANNTAWNLSVSMHIILFLTSFLINFNLAIMLAVFFLCSALYSAPPIQLSRKSILSHFDLSLTAFVIPFYAGIVYATGNFTINSIILNFMISLFFLFVSIFLLKDFKDIKGDVIKNKVTPVNQIGPAKTKMLSMLTTLIFFPLSLYTFTFIRPLNTALIPLFVLLFSALLFSEYKITEKPERYFGTGRLLLFLLVLTFFT